MFSLAHWMITVAVSIAIPKQMMSEKLVKKFRLNPIAFNTKKVTKNASGIERVAIKDSIAPTKMRTIKNTITKVVSPLIASLS